MLATLPQLIIGLADLAAAYGGSLKLDLSPLGGLRATLRLPRL